MLLGAIKDSYSGTPPAPFIEEKGGDAGMVKSRSWRGRFFEQGNRISRVAVISANAASANP